MKHMVSSVPVACLLLAAIVPSAMADRSGADAMAAAAAHVQEDAAQKPATATMPSIDERLDALLTESPADGAYSEPRRCISRFAYRNVDILNEEYMMFSSGGQHWVSRLARRCPSLRYNDLPVFAPSRTRRLCEGDAFYATNSMDLGMGRSGGRLAGAHAVCYLGEFEQISNEQAALLRNL